MCSIDVHEKEHTSSFDDDSSSGSGPTPSNSTIEAFILLGATIDFIGSWLESLEQNVLERCHMYAFNMEKLFQKTPVELPKQPSSKEKDKSLLHSIGGGWYVNKLGQKLPALNKRRLRKTIQERGG